MPTAAIEHKGHRYRVKDFTSRLVELPRGRSSPGVRQRTVRVFYVHTICGKAIPIAPNTHAEAKVLEFID